MLDLLAAGAVDYGKFRLLADTVLRGLVWRTCSLVGRCFGFGQGWCWQEKEIQCVKWEKFLPEALTRSALASWRLRKRIFCDSGLKM